jgi:large subunit ribosomal protein L22
MATVEAPQLEARAEARWVRTAPRKAQLVVREIRNLRVGEALTVLSFMTKAAARDVEAVLKSAIANAEANHGLSASDLYVSSAIVGEGPTLKRWQARARGRVGRIRKRTCHITIRVAVIPGTVVEPEAPARRARRAQAAQAPVEAPEAPATETPEAEEAAAEPPADEAAEEAPKPKRTRKAAEEPAAETAPATGEAAAEAPAAEEAPKPRRARAKKAEAPAAEEQPQAEAAEKPKTTRRRTKAEDESGEGS